MRRARACSKRSRWDAMRCEALYWFIPLRARLLPRCRFIPSSTYLRRRHLVICVLQFNRYSLINDNVPFSLFLSLARSRPRVTYVTGILGSLCRTERNLSRIIDPKSYGTIRCIMYVIDFYVYNLSFYAVTLIHSVSLYFCCCYRVATPLAPALRTRAYNARSVTYL